MHLPHTRRRDMPREYQKHSKLLPPALSVTRYQPAYSKFFILFPRSYRRTPKRTNFSNIIRETILTLEIRDRISSKRFIARERLSIAFLYKILEALKLIKVIFPLTVTGSKI